MKTLQRQAGLLGAVLLFIGYATGGLLAMAMTGKVDADPKVVLSAHLNGVLGCFWLCAVAATLPFTRFGEVGAKRLVLVTALPAYANWLITTIKAFYRVAGVGLDGRGANDAVFAALNAFVVIPSFVAVGAWVYGLMRPKDEKSA